MRSQVDRVAAAGYFLPQGQNALGRYAGNQTVARPVQHGQRDIRCAGQALKRLINRTQAGDDLALAL